MARETSLEGWITKGFWLAGAVNVLGMLAVSRLFTNTRLVELDPVVFSWMGQVAVVLWGLAYWAVARSYRQVPRLLWVFVAEKMVYAGAWAVWLGANGSRLPALLSESPATAAFYAGYGAIDFAFGIFFAWAAVRARKGSA